MECWVKAAVRAKSFVRDEDERWVREYEGRCEDEHLKKKPCCGFNAKRQYERRT